MEWLILGILIGIIIVSPFLYGCVGFVAFCWLAMGCMILWSLCFVRSLKQPQTKTPLLKFLVPFVFFCLLVFLQCIKLPIFLIKILSPEALKILDTFVSGKHDSMMIPVTLNYEATVLSAIKSFVFILLSASCVVFLTSRRLLQKVVTAIIVSGVLVCLFGMFQKLAYGNLAKVYWFDLDGSAGSAFGPFVNRNNFAGFVALIVPLALAMCFASQRLYQKILYLLAAVILSIGVLLSTSRTGVIVVTFEVLLLCMLVLKKGFNQKTKTIAKTVLAIFAGVVLIFFIEALPVAMRFRESSSAVDIRNLGHGYLWIDLARMIINFPLLGIGLGAFSSVSAMYKSSIIQYQFSYAHCDILQLCAETGFIGVSLFMWQAVILFKLNALKNQGSRDIFRISIAMGCFVSLIGAIAYALFDFNFQIPAVLVIVCVIVGIMIANAFLESEYV